MFDIHSVMTELSKIRPIFHSEADFQHALAWQIREAMPDCKVRLEIDPFPDDPKRMHLDIWLPTEEMVIELKYFGQKLDTELDCERFALSNRAAVNVTRYGFVEDIRRLEQVVTNWKPGNSGLAILLTNTPGFWKPSGGTPLDADFHVYEGRQITNKRELIWKNRSGQLREKPIKLQNSYTMRWKDFSEVPGNGNYRQFRYLVVVVGNNPAELPIS